MTELNTLETRLRWLIKEVYEMGKNGNEDLQIDFLLKTDRPGRYLRIQTLNRKPNGEIKDLQTAEIKIED